MAIPTVASPLQGVTVDDVVAAFRILHGNGSSEEKRAADLGLRRWQQSFDAWSISDQLLSTPTCPYEIQHMAALTLKTKIMYDITQLPSNSLGALCNSLLGHIRQFKNQQPRTLLIALGLAFADLTIHMATIWTSFLDALYQQLNEQQDIQALLVCLKLLPEENSNYSVLADPVAREAHAKILKSNLPSIVTRLNSIIDRHVDVETTARVLECFIEWVSFTEESRDYLSNDDIKQQSILSGTFVEWCLALLNIPNPSTDDAVADCLTRALHVASRSPLHHRELLQRMLHEISATEGVIRSCLTKAFQKDDAEGVLRLSRIYRLTGIGNADHIAVTLHKDPQLEKLLPILIRLTSVPYDVDDDARGLNGITSQMLDFWEVLAVSVNRVRTKVTETGTWRTETPAETASLPPGISDTAELGQLIEQQNRLFDLIIRTLLLHCLLPERLISGSDGNDFYQFRYDVCSCINRIAQVVSYNGVIQQVIQLLLESNNDDRKTQEAYLTCICRLIKYMDKNDEEIVDPEIPIIDPPMSQQSQTINSLFDLVSLFSGSLLTAEPPITLLDCFTRTAVAELIGQITSRLPLKKRPELVPKLLECLGHQVFQQDLVGADPEPSPTDQNHSSYRDSSTTLFRARRYLSEKSANAFRALCVSGQDLLIIQALIPNLVSALLRFDNISGGSYYAILEGIGVIVGAIKDDTKFWKASEELLNPPVTALVANSNDDRVIIVQTDRLSMILRSITPGEGENLRREALGSFLSTRLWPLLEQLLKVKSSHSIITEKCCRVLKHGLRCVHSKAFKPIVPLLATLIVNNARTVKMHPTFMYVSEWLIVEYCEDQQISGTLKILFNELSELGLCEIEKLIASKNLVDECYVVEDLYGMYCRYLRFCPTIPGTSPSLEKAIELGFTCLHDGSRIATSMICSFLGNLAYVMRTCEVEEGGLDQEEIRQASTNIQRLFYTFLQRIAAELFKIIESVPSEKVISAIASTFSELRFASREEEFEAAIRNGIVQLPPAVLATENYKEAIVQSMTHDAIDVMVDELYSRCRQVNLRLKEAELTTSE